MPEWLTTILGDASALQLVFWIIAICSLIAFVVKLWKPLTNLVGIINAVSGLPAFIKRTDDTLAGQDAKIQDIHHEVHYNNGSSVKDAQKRTEETVERIETGVSGLYTKVAELNDADAQMRDDFEKTQPRFAPKPPRE